MLTPVVLLLVALGVLAGTFGALVGLGGGVIIVPVLSLLLDLPIKTAVGISLVCVIATSSGAAAVYVQRRWTDLRLGMVLELATALGAITGALVVTLLPDSFLKGMFGAFLLYAAVALLRQRQGEMVEVTAEPPDYQVRNHPLGLGVSYVAGSVSGMLGIGGGPIKVPLMHLFMGVPLKVAAATSNFMMGVTAAASAFLYYNRGDVIVAVAAPLAVGVFAGALLGSHLTRRIHSRWIRWLLTLVLFYLAALMLAEAFGFTLHGRALS
ncbi:MAG TPA: sulfite exporter TauE/SafE family protein [Candidatus Acidoferrales bacterium]|nr:sulfite exporter TauE/SafE family protein [Candidatus Acidoferrales bacterium]